MFTGRKFLRAATILIILRGDESRGAIFAQLARRCETSLSGEGSVEGNTVVVGKAQADAQLLAA
jgi:hypothetical protein